MAFDYVIVGCGLFGGVFGRCVAERGCRVLIVDQRDHIGGNCFTEDNGGIQVHRYGSHIFHTNDEGVWRFVNRFARFNNYCHRIAANVNGRLLSFPINLLTLNQLWGVTTPDAARRKLAEARHAIDRPRNLEEWILSHVGDELYETFIRGYTCKQWGREPRDLPASIIRRIPVRLTYDDRYFTDRYQGIPIGGYTRMFQNMLDHDNIRVETGVDYFTHHQELRADARRLVFTGKIDQFFDYRHGRLEYRSLRFEHQERAGDYQGAAVINYPAAEVPHTRIIEHRHFEPVAAAHTVITHEFPEAYDETKTAYYPIRDERNTSMYARYRAMAHASGVTFGGRLGAYQYFDMHQVIAQAISMAAEATASALAA